MLLSLRLLGTLLLVLLRPLLLLSLRLLGTLLVGLLRPLLLFGALLLLSLRLLGTLLLGFPASYRLGRRARGRGLRRGLAFGDKALTDLGITSLEVVVLDADFALLVDARIAAA